MIYSKYELYFSKPRLNRYLLATHGNNENAKKMYVANMRLSQSFYSLISLLEVVLRNTLNDVLVQHFKDNDWIVNEKLGFMSDHSIDDYLKKEVDKAENKVKKAYGFISSNRIIAEQTLGFWAILFSKNHYKILKGQPIKIFIKLPPKVNRHHIYSLLYEIRKFRNRLYHNEPICFDVSGNFSIIKAREIKESIEEILNYIDSDILSSIDVQSDIENEFNDICRI